MGKEEQNEAIKKVFWSEADKRRKVKVNRFFIRAGADRILQYKRKPHKTSHNGTMETDTKGYESIEHNNQTEPER